mmetsp:Transcript_41605/g.64929  ORF Transcript_41605/g.64929 Transcript_41605/m.64929 type:complete len:146 (-) Transcript_41605:38-475(-)
MSLKIKLVDGVDVHAYDLFSKGDPYVVARLVWSDKSKQPLEPTTPRLRSPTAENQGKKPKWDYDFPPQPIVDEDVLFVQVWEDDHPKDKSKEDIKNELIGEQRVSIRDTVLANPGQDIPVSVTVLKKGQVPEKPTGTINFIIRKE